VHALASVSTVAALPLPPRWGTAGGDRAFDLRHVRDLAMLQSDWIAPMLRDLRAGEIDNVTLDFADGTRFVVRAGQRWRFWRRPVRSLAG
jgi:hypothetical protein